MSADRTPPAPNTSSPSVSGPSATAVAIRSAPRSVRSAAAGRRREDAGRSRRVGREPARQRSGADRRHPRRARPHRQGFKKALRQPRHRRADGDREPVLRPGVPRRRVHRERPRGARLRAAEDDARDGPGRRAGREDLRALGRARRHRDRCLPAAGRRSQAPARGDQLPLRVLDRPEVRLQVRAGSQAERAARRHLHGHDRRTTSGFIPTLDAPRDGRREPRGRARAHGRPELHARGRAGVGSGQAVPHRPQRPGVRAATTRTSASARRT